MRGSATRGRDFDVGDAIALGEGFHDFLWRGEVEIDEDLAQESASALARLFLEGFLELWCSDDTTRGEDLTDL